MTEEDYLNRFRNETPSLKAWGCFVVSKISALVTDSYGESARNKWFKIPPRVRVKKESSLIEKAFLLNKGWFSDVYEDVTDKVGVRFVVGLSEQVKLISEIVSECDAWSAIHSREFDAWKQQDPRIFDYQSAHLVVSSLEAISYEGIEIPIGTKCEVQIRTLLQHAYAELSHDTLYKSSITSEPEIHRLFAKSMALMETTDDMLQRAYQSTQESLADFEKIKELIFDVDKKILPRVDFEWDSRLSDFLIDKLRVVVRTHEVEGFDAFAQKTLMALEDRILERAVGDQLYRSPVISWIYYLAKTKRRSMPEFWPFELKQLEPIYSDLAISPHWTKDL